MGITFDTMEKNGNVKILLFFDDINVRTPNSGTSELGVDSLNFCTWSFGDTRYNNEIHRFFGHLVSTNPPTLLPITFLLLELYR